MPTPLAASPMKALLALGISGEEARLILGENLERIFGGQAERPAVADEEAAPRG